MRDDESQLTPREPEIEFLGRLARAFLRVLRVAFWLAGACAIGYGFWRSAQTDEHSGFVSALGMVWFALGLPLVLRAESLLARGNLLWATLGVSALLWFVPMALPDDHRWGFVLRMFATLIAFLSLLVWRTLWQLTRNAGRQA